MESNTKKNARTFDDYQLHDELGGFYQLYQIERSQQDSESDADGAEQLGMKSPYGQRDSILAKYHWTLDYLLWGIKWSVVQRMLIDASRYKYSKKKDGNDNYVEKVKAEQSDWEKMLTDIPTR